MAHGRSPQAGSDFLRVVAITGICSARVTVIDILFGAMEITIPFSWSGWILRVELPSLFTPSRLTLTGRLEPSTFLVLVRGSCVIGCCLILKWKEVRLPRVTISLPLIL